MKIKSTANNSNRKIQDIVMAVPLENHTIEPVSVDINRLDQSRNLYYKSMVGNLENKFKSMKWKTSITRNLDERARS